jgi:hypothetical protein
MTPKQHYQLAEQLVEKAEGTHHEVEQHLLLQFAQVHATLATCTLEYYQIKLDESQ